MRIAIAALLLLAGCTLATDLDTQKCDTDLDCGAGRTCSANNFCLLSSQATVCVRAAQCGLGEVCASGKCEAEETARWGCVDSMPEEPIASSGEVTLRMKISMRAGSGTVPSSAVTAVACARPTCEEMKGPFRSNQAGVVDVVVDPGFEGFVKLTGEALIDTYYQLQTPLNADPSVAEVTMLSAGDVAKIAQAAGAQVNLTERGVVLFQVLDCLGDLSADVSVTDVAKDPEVDIVYLAADKSADSDADATSGAGVAVALNASIGSPKFSLARQSSSKELGSVSVATIAGAVTYVPYQFGR